MRKKMQHVTQNEKGFVSIESILVICAVMILAGLILTFFSGAASSLSSSESSSYEMTEEEYAEQTENTRIELLDNVRELELKVEAETITATDSELVDEIKENLMMFDGSELDEQVSSDIVALMENPNDKTLKQQVKDQLDDVELYLLNQAPQQTLSTF